MAEIMKRKKDNEEYPALELFYEWYVHNSVPNVFTLQYIFVSTSRLLGSAGTLPTIHAVLRVHIQRVCTMFSVYCLVVYIQVLGDRQ